MILPTFCFYVQKSQQTIMIANTYNFQQEAYQYLIKDDYTKATSLYEQAIAAEPEIKSY